MISLENVTLRKNGKALLNNISWTVNKGEHWSILGLNGSGKTTLLKVINGYLWPQEGKVEVLGEKFGNTDLPRLRRKIGWVSASLQERIYKTDSVLSIVLSGMFASIGLYGQVHDEGLEKAAGIMRLLDCEKFKDEPYERLSQGERQRVLIARALMASPEILILDEPCSSLDLIAREQFLAFIEKLTKQPDGPTLIYVTHHVEEILPSFTHTLLLRDGEVFACGNSKEIMTERNLSSFYQHPVKLQKINDRFWISLKSFKNII